MASCTLSSSSSVCSSNGSTSIHLVEGFNMRMDLPSAEMYILSPEREGAGASTGTASPVLSVTQSAFNLDFNSTPPNEPLYPAFPLDGFHSMSASHQLPALASQTKENVCVTVRFRPLSPREVEKGDGVAWYADGDTVVRSEFNPSTAYAFDKVFGPATTTRGVYDVAAMNVVQGAMNGINGTVFAYGVTSSGKTYTMHGDPVSPGIIPLAVKDIFRIIQETPKREYLLRVSYLEIYNEVINDLLNPAGKNLRIREDAQGPYVEGIKEQVVLSPVHALSLIAAGEELRHVSSNNYNLLSSRSHTVFTLRIESSPRLLDTYDEVEEVTISQLNLIDLAGSESSKTGTTGERRKEGSYINKSLLTLGTVIGKLSEGRSSHVPYRDSKLTRLLQSSLCGYGRVSLICTLTPASSNMEETHNTLKFAQRAKRVIVQATANRMIDERSLIRKYQREIFSLKEEIDQLKRGIYEQNIFGMHAEDSTPLCQQLEAREARLILRLAEEERAKAALVERIQRLTKLILVSSRSNTKLQVPCTLHGRRHSFGGEEVGINSFGGISSKRCWEDDMPIEYSTRQAKLGDQLPRACSHRNVSNTIEFHGGFSNSSNLDGDSRGIVSDVEFSDSGSYGPKGSYNFVSNSSTTHGQMLLKAVEIENLKQERLHLQEENQGLQTHIKKLLEEASYAKELASAAAVELRNLAEEVTKLSFKNSELASQLSFMQRDNFSSRHSSMSPDDGLLSIMSNSRNTQMHHRKVLSEASPREEINDSYIYDIESWKLDPADLKRELSARKDRERCLEAALAEKEQIEMELMRKLEEGKERESDLENDLAGMFVQLALLRKEKGNIDSIGGDLLSSESAESSTTKEDELESLSDSHLQIYQLTVKELQNDLEQQKRSVLKLHTLVSRLRSEDLEGVELHVLEELQKVHVEALTKLFQAKGTHAIT